MVSLLTIDLSWRGRGVSDMSMRYEDFTIQIGPRRGDDGHPVRILSSPAGEGAGVFYPPFAGDAVDLLLQGGIRSGRTRSVAAPVDMGRHLGVAFESGVEMGSRDLTAHELGDQLFRALFSGQIQTLYDQSLGTVRSRPGCGLRVKLKLDAGEREVAHLSSLPWEFLWRRETEDFLSLSRLNPLVRYLDVPRPASPIQVGSKLRILVAVASPSDLPSLAMDKERGLLEDIWRRWKGVEMTFLEKATPQALRQMLLTAKFHAVHFMGHGGFDPVTGEGVLFFERGDGGSEAVSGRALATMLKDFKTLGLVFLNACETARTHAEGVSPFSGVANALVLGGLPAVIAMQFPISDQAAIAFSAAFYQRLAAGDPIDAAVVEGRQSVLADLPGSMEWGTPVLFLRIPDAHVFLVSGRRKEADAEDDRGGTNIWRTRALGMLLVAALGAGIYPLLNEEKAPLSSETGSTDFFPIDLSQTFASTAPGISGILTRVEIFPNGRMRFHFRFRNQSPKVAGLGFDFRKTYLADPQGNRYAVLAADGGAKGGATAIDRLEPGREVDRWIEFPAPRDNAQSFKVGLSGYEGGPGFPLFTVKLPAYPKSLSTTTSKPPAPADSALLAVSQAVSTNIQGLQSALEGVELLANGRMRWRFAFLNNSERDQTIGLDYSRIYLQDKSGNRYSVLGSDTGAGVGEAYSELLQRALRAQRWIEFPAPLNSARDFTVVLVSHDGSLRFIPFAVRIPYYPPKYSRTVASAPRQQPSPPPTETAAVPVETPIESPPPSAEPELPQKKPLEPPMASIPFKSDNVWNTSIEGLQGSLQALELLDGNRVRWTIELHNQTGSAQEIGFNLAESYLSDNLGHRYTIVRSDAERLHREVIPAGGRTTHWFEFPSPASGASRFIAVLSSHSPAALRYRPFQIDLPKKTK